MKSDKNCFYTFRAKLEKLPDKGAKIRAYHEKVLAEIQKRDEINAAAEQFSQLNIASIGRKVVENLEWSEGRNANEFDDTTIDSDDDPDGENDPLKIIAGSNQTNKIVKVQKEETIITEQDLNEIKELTEGKEIEASVGVEVMDVGITNKSRINKLVKGIEVKSTENENLINRVTELLEPHALQLCEKELTTKGTPKLKFLPSRTTVTDVHNPEREMQRKTRKNWEATAATPPLLRHNGVKTLSLEESIEAQRKNFKALKKVKEEQAKERLLLQQELRDKTIVEGLVNDEIYFDGYRDPRLEDESESELFDEEEEIVDDDGGEIEKGGVIYKVDS